MMDAAILVRVFPCLQDNYGFLAHDPDTGETAAIDTPDARAVLEVAEDSGWGITQIWNTHHHWDHAGGNAEVKAATGARVIAPAAEADKIAGVDRAVAAGDTVRLGGLTATVYETPGHTAGHVVYHLPDVGVGFVGDTIFPLGCGRLFEGTAEQMWASLSIIAEWPDDTSLYSAHEYAASNARFAVTIDPENAALAARAEEIDAMRGRGEATVPTTVGREKTTNPFLRAADPGVRARLGLAGAEDAAVFAEIRRRKDSF